MPKPWSKYEVGFINHPKFRHLSASAIALWVEAKNWVDLNLSDGLIPARILPTFRHYRARIVRQLSVSCGAKNETEQYAPLWEPHPLGYKMHDYLDHNDSRDETLARLQDAAESHELRRLSNRRRQADHRAKRKAELEALRNALRNAPQALDDALRTVTSRTPLETASVSEVLVLESTEVPVPLLPVRESARHVTRTASAEPAAPLDQWFRQLCDDYPENRVTPGHLAEMAFVRIFMTDPRPAVDVWAEMRANLENQKAGHEWRTRSRFIPKLQRWLEDGSWKQRHSPDPPEEQAGGRKLPAWARS